MFWVRVFLVSGKISIYVLTAFLLPGDNSAAGKAHRGDLRLIAASHLRSVLSLFSENAFSIIHLSSSNIVTISILIRSWLHLQSAILISTPRAHTGRFILTSLKTVFIYRKMATPSGSSSSNHHLEISFKRCILLLIAYLFSSFIKPPSKSGSPPSSPLRKIFEEYYRIQSSDPCQFEALRKPFHTTRASLLSDAVTKKTITDAEYRDHSFSSLVMVRKVWPGRSEISPFPVVMCTDEGSYDELYKELARIIGFDIRTPFTFGVSCIDPEDVRRRREDHYFAEGTAELLKMVNDKGRDCVLILNLCLNDPPE